MSNPVAQRLWLMIGFIVILIFVFMFMSNGSPDRYDESWEDDYEYEYEAPAPKDFGIEHVLALGAIAGAILLTFHPFYGGLSPRYRFWYQLGFIILAFTLAGFLNYKTLSINIVVGGVICWMVNVSAIPLLIAKKRYGLVHAFLNLTQQIAPKNANLWITRAQVYYLQGEFEKSIQATNQAIEVTPRLKKKEEEGWFHLTDSRLSGAHQTRMHSYFALAQHDLALEDAEILVRLEPSQSVHYMNRSMALRKRGEFAAASADLDIASQLKLEPVQQAFLIYSRADLLDWEGKTQEAIDLYKTAFDIVIPEPNKKALYPEFYASIGMLELRLGNDETAEQAFKSAQAINPEYVPFGLIALYARRGQWSEAASAWQNLIRLAPAFARLDILRRHLQKNLFVMDLIEEVIARSNTTSSNPTLNQMYSA